MYVQIWRRCATVQDAFGEGGFRQNTKQSPNQFVSLYMFDALDTDCVVLLTCHGCFACPDTASLC